MWWVLSTLLLFASTGSSPGDAVLPDPGNLVDYRGRNGETFQFLVRASTGGGAWGTDVYTDDSMLATAAVHAGALGYGKTGVVEVTILPGGESYTGSMRYGVTTDSCGPWYGSYSVASIQGDEARAAPAPAEKAAAWGMFIPVLAVSGAFWLLFSATSGRMGSCTAHTSTSSQAFWRRPQPFVRCFPPKRPYLPKAPPQCSCSPWPSHPPFWQSRAYGLQGRSFPSRFQGTQRSFHR